MLGNNFKTILKEERWSKLPTFTVTLFCPQSRRTVKVRPTTRINKLSCGSVLISMRIWVQGFDDQKL
jgi:hypothetical protein